VCAAALARAGPLGGILAFIMWSLPGLVVLTLAGVVFEAFIDPDSPPWFLIGLPPAAISLVFYAFYLFAVKLDRLGTFLALFSCLAAILLDNGGEDFSPRSSQWVFPVFMIAGGIITLIDSKRANPMGVYNNMARKGDAMQDAELMQRIGLSVWFGILILLLWIAILAGSILAVESFDVENDYLEIFEVMFRIGSIIYGGGQVVLPMLQDEIVPYWMTNDQFLQGFGLSTSMPGPLFNFSAYCGAIYKGVPGALIAFLGLFGPGIILIFAIMPFWVQLRNNFIFRAILSGVNSSAIGLVGAACVILWE
jgi:chromate transporter